MTMRKSKSILASRVERGVLTMTKPKTTSATLPKPLPVTGSIPEAGALFFGAGKEKSYRLAKARASTYAAQRATEDRYALHSPADNSRELCASKLSVMSQERQSSSCCLITDLSLSRFLIETEFLATGRAHHPCG